tara:strand:+ start:76 stop:333 length:258 start_codon:yes stop_codon:yes gene_type:complete
MDDETPEYRRLISYRDDLYEMLYLTDYELRLSKKRRMKDQEVYTQDELKDMLGVKEVYRSTSRNELIVMVVIIVSLICALLADLY